LIFAICRNPVISNVLIRWALIGSSLVEVSGSIGSVYSLLIPYAFSSTINKKRSIKNVASFSRFSSLKLITNKFFNQLILH
jgi:hypothetical protein